MASANGGMGGRALGKYQPFFEAGLRDVTHVWMYEF